MNILQIITLSGLGGAQSMVIHLANEFSKQGHEICVVSSPGGRMWDSLDTNIIKKECQYFKREIDVVSDLKAIFMLRKVCNHFKPDIIHLHSSKAGAWGRIALGKYKARIIYTIHGFDTILKANRILLPVEKILARRAKYIIPVCDYDCCSLNREGIYNTHTIKNAIPDLNDNTFEIDPFNEARRNRKKVVLSIARLSSQKKFAMFLEVASLMKKEAVMFYWIGNQISVNSLPSNVRCLGEIPSASKLIKFADIFVLFSNYEGLPISVIEALSSSVPVVASAVGGITEILKGDNGIAVKNLADEAVSAIQYFLLDEDVMAYAKKAARLSYQQEFTIDKMLQSYMNIYRECLIGKSPESLSTAAVEDGHRLDWR
ncbi:MAG: glycosyltransferase [Thermodesulfobacteriota bacterium]